jgi:hypothetical protein
MLGEPFLRQDFWQIASLIRALSMELTIITIGTVYDRETFSQLRSLNPIVPAQEVGQGAARCGGDGRGAFV